MRACKELDVDTVAIYSDTDETALFTKYADEAKPLNSSILAQSYLDIDKIMDIAIETGADAIHPGYGFLSENPVLGERCDENNITLIGISNHNLNEYNHIRVRINLLLLVRQKQHFLVR